MLFLKQVADHMWLLLSAVEMTTHTGHHLRPFPGVCGATTAFLRLRRESVDVASPPA
jgi:hypothetical protein